MRKLIYMLALLVFFGSVPKAMALDQTSQAIGRAHKEEIVQQNRQEAHWKALESEAAKFLQHWDRNTINLNYR